MKIIKILPGLLVAISVSSYAADWNSIGFPEPTNLTGVQFTHPDTGFVCTSDGRVGMTFNAGQSWSLLNVSLGTPLEDLHFLNSDTGLVCGHQGSMFRTTDGGYIWRRVLAADTILHLLDIEMLDRQVGLAIGMRSNKETPYASVVLRTIDAGASWEEQESVGMGPFELFYRPGRALSILSFGRLHFSIDQGLSWQEVRTIDGSPGRTVSLLGKTGLIAGPSGLCARSADSGRTWIKVAQDEQKFFIACELVDENTGYIGGATAVLRRTDDAGVTWTDVAMPEPFTVLDMYLIEDYLWVVGTKSGIIRKKVR
jgi:photosystem II stability/assembly factor-like uncharacterized protein